MDNVVLIGMPGSGKSTVGVLLAKALGYGFLDTDLTIQRQEGALLQELLDAKGVDWFLDAEERAICSVVVDRCVVAPGGSAVRNLSTRGIAMERGQTLADVMARRAPLYEQYADHIVEIPSGQDLAGVVERVLALLDKEHKARIGG